jgi:hypothetical protein
VRSRPTLDLQRIRQRPNTEVAFISGEKLPHPSRDAAPQFTSPPAEEGAHGILSLADQHSD